MSTLTLNRKYTVKNDTDKNQYKPKGKPKPKPKPKKDEKPKPKPKKTKKKLNFYHAVNPGESLSGDYLYFIWSPEGKTNPKHTYPTHKGATRTAWIMEKKYPDQSFFVGKFDLYQIHSKNDNRKKDYEGVKDND